MQLASTNIIQRSFSYPEFITYVGDLFENGKVTGHEQDQGKMDATKLNLSRIKRLNKTIELDERITEFVRSVQSRWTWVLILEGWCGDGAQIAPYINKLAELNRNIELKIVLRDENPELMNNYLTNGTRSIPIFICLDSETENEIGFWGPRPKAVLNWIENFKNEHPGYSSIEFKKGLHGFYAKDKGTAICNDLYDVLSEWSMKCKKSA